MRFVSVKPLNLMKCIRLAQEERICLCDGEKPLVVLTGVEGQDKEQVELSYDDELWKLIEKRRKQKTIPFEEVVKRLNGRSKARRKVSGR